MRFFSFGLDGASLVLAFHNVIPDRERPRGDHSLHLELSRYREILDWLPDIFEVVPLESIVQEVPIPFGRPRIAITFDDAYEGAVDLGITELARRGLPATVFVISGMRDGQTFWWDALADSNDGRTLKIREEVLRSAAGRESVIRSLAKQNRWALSELGGPFVASTWKRIADLACLEGITIAHHTRTHANAAVLTKEELLVELETGRTELEERVPEARPWLAWPYGRSSARARSVAMHVGFKAAFRVDGGLWKRSKPPAPRFRFPRLNVPAGLTLEGFRLRAVGLLGR